MRNEPFGRDTGCYNLWRSSVTFVKRGLEVGFPPHEDLVDDDLTERDFETWKVAQFVRGLADLEVPSLWQERGYPPAAAGGRVVELPSDDLRYLRVTARLLRSYSKPTLHFRDRQIAALERIAGDEPGPSPRVKLPATMRLAGALDATRSQFGDEFFNFPPFLGQRPAPGSTQLSGWIQVAFSPPQGDVAPFTLAYFGVGSRDLIEWGGGHVYTFARNRAFPSPSVPNLPAFNDGKLDLRTGKVTELRVFATFQNSTIGEVDKINRIPFAFPFIYPPLPIQPPPGVEPPAVEAELDFELDDDGNIVGLRFLGHSLAFVTLFPFLPPGQSPFPPFSFGQKGSFHFANPTLCLPGTPPASCPTAAGNPDGVLLPLQAFFHPHLSLVAGAVEAVAGPGPAPVSAPVALADAVAFARGGVLVVAGGTTAAGPTDDVRIFDPAQGTWTAGPALPAARAAAGGAAVGGRLFVLGGWTKSGAASDRVYVLDPGATSWEAGPKLPVAVAEAAVAADGGRIYVVAGRTGKGKSRPIVADVQILDVAAGTWSAGAPAALPVAGARAGVLGGKVYVANGEVEGGTTTSRVSIYDPASDSWGLGPNRRQGDPEVPLPGITGHTGAVCDGRLYLVGGRRTLDGPTADELFELDPALGTLWLTNISAGLPVAGAAAATLGGTLWVVGGRVQNGADVAPGRLTDVVQAFRPSQGWAISGARPIAQSALVLNEAALAVGPFDGPPGPARGPAAPLAPGGRGLLLGWHVGPGATVTVGGQSAPVAVILPDPTGMDAVHFLVPDSVAPDPCAPLFVERTGGASDEVPVAVGKVAPGLYVYSYGFALEPDFLDRGPALAANGDGTLNFADQPTVPGGEVVLFATGLGTDAPGAIAARLEVLFGHARKAGTVLAVAPAAGLPGVLTVAAKLPAKVELSNNVPVLLRLDGVESNRAVVAVREEAARRDPPLPLAAGIAFVFGPPPT